MYKKPQAFHRRPPDDGRWVSNDDDDFKAYTIFFSLKPDGVKNRNVSQELSSFTLDGSSSSLEQIRTEFGANSGNLNNTVEPGVNWNYENKFKFRG